MIDMDLVNVVGGGDLGVALDLPDLVDTHDFPDQSYEPEIYPGFKFKLNNDGPTILLFSSGNYHITGATSIEELEKTHDNLVDCIGTELRLDTKQVQGPEVRNLVYVSDYGAEIDLNEVSLALGLEDVEYSPKKHPGLHYTPETKGHLMVFRTGKMILTGVKNPDDAAVTVGGFVDKLDSLFDL